MAWGKREPERSEWGSEVRDVVMPEVGREAEVTVIGPGARLEGLLVSGGPLRIEGEVKGEVRAEGDVLVAPPAKVEGEMRAQNVRIEGRFSGTIEVAGKAELGRSANVEASITCQSLVIGEGAVFNGRTTMNSGASIIALSDVEHATEQA